MQFTEDEMGMPIEHPLAGRNVGPGRRNACAADASPKKNSHVHVVSTGKTDALQWKLDLTKSVRIGGVETESDPVVTEDIVAAADCSADLVGLGIETVESDVKILVVVDQPDFRLEF